MGIFWDYLKDTGEDLTSEEYARLQLDHLENRLAGNQIKQIKLEMKLQGYQKKLNATIEELNEIDEDTVWCLEEIRRIKKYKDTQGETNND